MEIAMLLSAASISDHYPDRERSVPALYAEVLGQGVLADELGYYALFLAEHHFHEYGAVPNPAVLLASLAQRTKQLRLGTSISVLPFGMWRLLPKTMRCWTCSRTDGSNSGWAQVI